MENELCNAVRGFTKRYNRGFRSANFNLRRNVQLRQDVQAGIMSAAEFVDRALNNSQSLATPARQAERVAYQEADIRAHALPQEVPVCGHNPNFDTERWEYQPE